MVEGAVEYLQSGSLGTIVTCMAARRPLRAPVGARLEGYTAVLCDASIDPRQVSADNYLASGNYWSGEIFSKWWLRETSASRVSCY